MVNPVIAAPLTGSESPIEKPGSVLNFLQDVPEAARSSACVRIYSREFSATESTFEKIATGFPLKPPSYPEQYSTFRWRHYSYQKSSELARDGVVPGKAVIDLGSLESQQLDLFTGEPNNPAGGAICDEEDIWADASSALLMANHYLGASRKNMFQNDGQLVSRIAEYLDNARKRSTDDEGLVSDEARGWLKGFVEQIGLATAEHLLAKVPTNLKPTRRLQGPIIDDIFALDASTKAPAVASTKAPAVASTKAPAVASTKAPNVASTKAPNVASTKAPAVASTKAPAVVSTKAPAVASTKAPAVASTKAPAVASTKAPTVASTKAPSVASTKAPVVASTKAPTTRRRHLTSGAVLNGVELLI